MSAVTLDKISVGVFAGANTPNQEIDLGKVNSN